MEKLAGLITALLAVGSFLGSRFSSQRHLRTMKAQQDLIVSLPEDSLTRKNMEEALALTSERYLTELKEGGTRSRDRVRRWLDVLGWVLLGVGGYYLASIAPKTSGLDSFSDLAGLAMSVLAIVLMVYAAVGWGRAMNRAVFG